MNALTFVKFELPNKRKLDKQLEYLKLESTGKVKDDKVKVANYYVTNRIHDFIATFQATGVVIPDLSSNPKSLCTLKNLLHDSTTWVLLDHHSKPVPPVQTMRVSEALNYLSQNFTINLLTQRRGDAKIVA